MVQEWRHLCQTWHTLFSSQVIRAEGKNHSSKLSCDLYTYIFSPTPINPSVNQWKNEYSKESFTLKTCLSSDVLLDSSTKPLYWLRFLVVFNVCFKFNISLLHLVRTVEENSSSLKQLFRSIFKSQFPQSYKHCYGSSACLSSMF